MGCHDIYSIKSGVIKTIHKYRIEIPISVYHAYKITNKNNNTFWQDAICNDMHNVGIDFDILDRYCHAPVVWNKFTGNIVFGINIDFTREVH